MLGGMAVQPFTTANALSCSLHCRLVRPSVCVSLEGIAYAFPFSLYV